MARLAGLEPTASSSAGMRSFHLSYKRASLEYALNTFPIFALSRAVYGAEGGTRTHTPAMGTTS